MGVIFRRRKCYTGKVKGQPVYSTDEMCIGTVDINGVEKKLYQKTIPATMPTVTTQGTTVSAFIDIGTNVDVVFGCSAQFSNGSGVYYQVPYASGNVTSNIFVINYNSSDASSRNKIRLMQANTAWSGNKGYITLQYTKP